MSSTIPTPPLRMVLALDPTQLRPDRGWGSDVDSGSRRGAQLGLGLALVIDP